MHDNRIIDGYRDVKMVFFHFDNVASRRKDKRYKEMRVLNYLGKGAM